MALTPNEDFLLSTLCRSFQDKASRAYGSTVVFATYPCPDHWSWIIAIHTPTIISRIETPMLLNLNHRDDMNKIMEMFVYSMNEWIDSLHKGICTCPKYCYVHDGEWPK